MGWGGHPDTLTLGRARGVAERSGYKEHSLEWMQAFRDGYERAADESYPESLAAYLTILDQHIVELKGDSHGS